ncbi:MAG TPA: chemotaxis protein CheW [Syntrophobacteria bacterium]|nr:chemotaxis protein CheW [Syntrophobacteria bacterium]
MEGIALPATLDILTFRIGPFLLGTDAGPVARLALLTSGVGDSAPQVDLRLWCGLGPAAGARRHLLVVGGAAGEVAYVVDQVGDLITVNLARQIWPLPPLIERHKRWRRLWGVCAWEDELVLLVDLVPAVEDCRAS